jgi:hypothetical protein
MKNTPLVALLLIFVFSCTSQITSRVATTQSKYNSISQVAPNRFLVSTNNKWGIVDSLDRVIVPLVYDKYFNGAVKKGEKWGFIGNNDTTSVRLVYDEIVPEIVGEMWGVRRDRKWGLVNKMGISVTEVTFDTLMYSGGSMLAVRRGRKWGYLNDKGIVSIPIEYDDVVANRASSDLFQVKKGKKWIWVDKNNECKKNCE